MYYHCRNSARIAQTVAAFKLAASRAANGRKLASNDNSSFRGRKVEVGRELHMSVGNMVLSTGLTRTVARGQKRPDFFVKS